MGDMADDYNDAGFRVSRDVPPTTWANACTAVPAALRRTKTLAETVRLAKYLEGKQQ